MPRPGRYEEVGTDRLTHPWYNGYNAWGTTGDHWHGDEQDFLGQSPKSKYFADGPPADPCGGIQTYQFKLGIACQVFDPYPEILFGLRLVIECLQTVDGGEVPFALAANFECLQTVDGGEAAFGLLFDLEVVEPVIEVYLDLGIDLEVIEEVPPGSVEFTSPGAFSWIAVTDTVTVKLWGGGGGGGDIADNTESGGGGGGGAYSQKVVAGLTVGATYNGWVGNGPPSQAVHTDPPADGEDSWFVDSLTALAVGGKGGNRNVGGLGGDAADCIGDMSFSGGKGGDGALGAPPFPFGGGGGGGAGSGSDGSDGGDGDSSTNGAPGAGGTGDDPGGEGGLGGSFSIDTPGEQPGGGAAGSGPFAGSLSGGDGKVIISWE